jgi:hypothetical protein
MDTDNEYHENKEHQQRSTSNKSENKHGDHFPSRAIGLCYTAKLGRGRGSLHYQMRPLSEIGIIR